MSDLKNLKSTLHANGLTQGEKLMAVVDVLGGGPVSLSQIRMKALEAGWKIPKSFNIASIFSKLKGRIIKVPEGWEITDDGKKQLSNKGVLKSAIPEHIAADLRAYLEQIRSIETRAFMEEAIKCYEYGLWRAAVLMSWVGAVHILYEKVFAGELDKFNDEARRVNLKWKTALTIDDLALMGEADFLDRLEKISVIGKSVKLQLKACLDLRNGCGHPNSLKLSQHTVTRHLEVLILNVYKPFS